MLLSWEDEELLLRCRRRGLGAKKRRNTRRRPEDVVVVEKDEACEDPASYLYERDTLGLYGLWAVVKPGVVRVGLPRDAVDVLQERVGVDFGAVEHTRRDVLHTLQRVDTDADGFTAPEMRALKPKLSVPWRPLGGLARDRRSRAVVVRCVCNAGEVDGCRGACLAPATGASD